MKVRDEIVTFGAPDELEVSSDGVVGGGQHLKPGELHRLVEERDDVVFFDGRNRFEAEIGRFRGAIVPDVETTRDFVELLDSGAYDHLKDTPIVTYCTGGVRCEVLSSLMRKRGFGEVYQLEGGIVRYGESFGNAGLWEGSLYVFDERQTMTFGADASVLGACTACGAAGHLRPDIVGIERRHPAIGLSRDALQDAVDIRPALVGMDTAATQPQRDRLLYRQRPQAGVGNLVQAGIQSHGALGPQRSQDVDLLVK